MLLIEGGDRYDRKFNRNATRLFEPLEAVNKFGKGYYKKIKLVNVIDNKSNVGCKSRK